MKNERRLFFLLLILVLLGIRCTPSFIKKPYYKPLIGLTSVYENSKSSIEMAYVQAIREAGGIPVILPVLGEDQEAIKFYTVHLDGLLLVGGRDIPPQSYKQLPHESVEIMPKKRYDFENLLVAKWLNSNKPILGICLGAQMINVVSGGTLIQDIPSQIQTDIAHRGGYSSQHIVIINKSSMLHEIMGVDSLMVNSSHHQAIKELGKGLIVAAWCSDGVVEAIELKGDRFVLGIQWHPEFSNNFDREKIYKAFINAVMDYKKKENE